MQCHALLKISENDLYIDTKEEKVIILGFIPFLWVLKNENVPLAFQGPHGNLMI